MSWNYCLTSFLITLRWFLFRTPLSSKIMISAAKTKIRVRENHWVHFDGWGTFVLSYTHLTPKNLEFRGGKIQFATLENKVQSKIKSLFWFFTLTSLSQETLLLEIYIFFQQKTWFRGVQNTSSSFFVAKGTFFFSPGIKEQKLAILISPLLEPSSNQEEKNASHSGLARKSEKYFLYCAQVLYCSETKFCEVR